MEAQVSSADLFVAVTPIESTNITACMLATNLGAKKTLARIDNQEYLQPKNKEFFKSMGIDSLIYPEKLAAEEIVNNHTETWEGDYDNVRKPNWYSLANEESEAIFANIDKNSNHYLTVRIRLREVDDGGSDDDIDNIYFDLFYDASTKKLTYDKNKHNSGANSRNSMTPIEFVFGQATPTRFYFDPKDGEESVKGYFDLTLTWGK